MHGDSARSERPLLPKPRLRVRQASLLIWRRPNSRAGLACPMEFLDGRPLSTEELEPIRRQIEESFEVIAAVDDEIPGIWCQRWRRRNGDSRLPPGGLARSGCCFGAGATDALEVTSSRTGPV